MKTGVRITAFALAASFGTAYAVGAGMDPVTSHRNRRRSAPIVPR